MPVEQDLALFVQKLERVEPDAGECLLWVSSGHSESDRGYPLCPQRPEEAYDPEGTHGRPRNKRAPPTPMNAMLARKDGC
jgi:hypothetical protein